MNRRSRRQPAFALMLVLIVVATAAILGVSYLLGASMHFVGTTNLVLATRARYLAESGLEHSLLLLQTDPELLKASTEASQLGPFYVDGSSDNYTIYAAPGAGTDDLYTIIATGFCKGIKQSASFTVYSPNLFAELVQSYGPVAYWRLGESSGAVAQDVTGAHNGVYVNGITLNQGGALIGSNNTAARFDGVNDYTDTQIWDVATVGLTLVAWINADDFDTLTDPRILSKARNAMMSYYWTLRTMAVDGDIRLHFDLRTINGRRDLTADSGNIQPGQWVFVAAVYDGNRMYLYQDAVEVGRRSHSGDVEQKDNAPVWIGGNPTDPTAKPWKGSLDEVAVFDRALTPEQITALYKARRPDPVVVRWDD